MLLMEMNEDLHSLLKSLDHVRSESKITPKSRAAGVRDIV